MLTCRHSTMTGPGVSAAVECASMSSRRPRVLGAAGEDVDRPVLQSLVAGNRCWCVEPRTEAGEHPVDGSEQDLDAVVDSVLEKKQRHPDRRQAEASLGNVDNGGDGEDGRARKHTEDGGGEHQWDGASAPFPTRPERLGDGHSDELSPQASSAARA